MTEGGAIPPDATNGTLHTRDLQGEAWWSGVKHREAVRKGRRWSDTTHRRKNQPNLADTETNGELPAQAMRSMVMKGRATQRETVRKDRGWSDTTHRHETRS